MVCAAVFIILLHIGDHVLTSFRCFVVSWMDRMRKMIEQPECLSQQTKINSCSRLAFKCVYEYNETPLYFDHPKNCIQLIVCSKCLRSFKCKF